MGKKSNRYVTFIQSANSVDYRKDSVIIDRFNSSVRLFKRFQEINLAGDPELAREKLVEAGTSMYQCCEWALKNYLYKRYEEMYSNGELSQQDKISKIDKLASKKANIAYLVGDFKQFSSPLFSTLGISVDDITYKANNVNNQPKHEAKTPDPTNFKKIVGELRKIIKNYIDVDSQLDLVEDSIYGEGNGWYQVLEGTSDFSEAFSYILITKRTPPIDIRGLFTVKWDMVIDLDPSSDVDGLDRNYETYTNISPWKRILNQVEARKRFSISGKPYWVFANGISDDPSSIVSNDKWITKYGRHLSTLIEEFHKVYAKPVKVFVYPMDYEKNLERTVQAFNDVYDDGNDVDFYVLSPESEYAKIDEDNFNVVELTIENFCHNLSILNNDKMFSRTMHTRKFPSSKSEAIINEGFFVELQDSFEVVYSGIENEESDNAIKTSRREFYCGNNEISWYGLKERFDIVRADVERVKEKLIIDLKEKKGRLLTRVCYEPGVGGTTMLRRIAWELAGSYPTLIIKKNNDQTARNLQKIYDMTNLPILILADSNNIELEDVKRLQFDLKTMGFGFVICFFERKVRGVGIADAAVYTVVGSLNEDEVLNMSSKLADYLINEDAKKRIDEIVNTPNSQERSPFIMSMYAFDAEFKGIKPYISKFLRGMNDQAKKILFALSLSDYGNVSLDIQYFVNLFGNDANELLTADLLELRDLIRVDSDNRKTQVRIKYHLFGEEILKQLSLGEQATEISFTALVNNILTFIEDSRTYTINQSVLNVLRSLFITRIADTNSEKPAFSPLIQRLKEENGAGVISRYDDSNDAIIRIFNKLVEVYPEEPHFTAHLARYYFYIDKNYEKGFENIDSAIDLSETMYGTTDPLLYHMKGMGYSSRITNLYIKQIYSNIAEGRGEDNKAVIDAIELDAEKAFELFKLVRESNNGVAGHVSEINLCIQVATMARNLLDEQNEDFCHYLSSQDGSWVMKYIDRATDLWEECKKLVLESNTEDLDGIGTRLASLTSNLERTIDLWEEYIKSSDGSNKQRARRLLARAYEKKRRVSNSIEEQEYLNRIVVLMEANMIEESQHSGNIRIWFDAIMKLKNDNQDALIQDAILKLNHWVALTDSVEAHYYRFVLKFIQAIGGSELAQADLPKLLRDLKAKSNHIFNRTAPQHWLTTNGSGLGALMINSRGKKDALSEEEMASKMYMLTGRVSNNYVNDSHAYINYRGVEVYFNPSATKGKIDKTKINQRVKFGMGFSYDGPRAYNSSIKLMEGEPEIQEIQELTSGMIVKCEVVRNVTHYTQVRIIGYPSASGSIHENELTDPYSGENRPAIGEILDALVLFEQFDNKIQRKVWMLSLNTSAGMLNETSDNTMKLALQKSGYLKE